VTTPFRVDALLFDLDGTLIEPSIDFAAMKTRVLEVCLEAGVDATEWASLPVLEILAHVNARLRGHDPRMAEQLAITADRAIIAVEMQAAEQVRAYPGVIEALQHWKDSGYAVGIVTRNSRRAVDRVLSRWPLPHHVLLTRDDVPHVKPDARHLRAALEALGTPGRPAIMCGDHPMDVAAGQAIGAFTVAVRTDSVSAEALLASGPDLIVDRVIDLRDYLDGPGVARPAAR
jgi:phosphoglycolate phosphatase